MLLFHTHQSLVQGRESSRTFWLEIPLNLQTPFVSLRSPSRPVALGRAYIQRPNLERAKKKAVTGSA